MQTHILKEGDWEHFVQEEIFPLLVHSNIFALVGDLGAGKTTFSKTFLKQLGVKQHVQSPTFSIINSYDITKDSFMKVFHVDVYRIDDLKELKVLHFDEILSNSEHIIIIEWADKIKSLIPMNAVWIRFDHDTLETRKVTIQE